MSDETPKYDPLQQKEVIDDMFENWFLEYASYVILERAVPAIEDGLKPVQRRILHALKEMDDGRFNKVANVIGSSMQYHPHGDASIGDAIVTMGQKNLLLDTQGNWGDVRTGDGAAAPRYIEVRLSKFANDVLFNEDTTEWQMSYDGRKREPVNLPAKFPLLLAQGVEGIAVGLSTKVMPHNFIELCEASISYLKKEPFQLYPDFLTGGMVDVTNYNDGARGGKIKVRAKIAEIDKKTLEIQEIPFSTTTSSLIESIIKANDAGKIKIKKVEDNTAKDVSIIIHLAPNTSPDITIDALYAFTECESSISPNACVIVDNKPHFITVSDILKQCTEQTKHLLQRELEIKRHELKEKLLYSSLEKIFIENRIYRQIEECTTFEDVVATVDRGLEPYKKDFYREIVEEDLLRLLEIKIKRISKYDSFKADELMKRLQDELAEVEDNLANIVRFTISFYRDLLKKYSKGRERKTEIRQFEAVQATVVAANNQKLYVDREGGFIGYGLKKDEYVMDCSDIDDIIAFKRDGKYVITKIQEKVFVGKDIIYCSVFRKNDERKIYNAIYIDAKSGTSYAKRFFVTGITRDKEYDVTMGNPKSKILYFTANDNGEAETVAVNLTANSTAKKKQFDWDFSTLTIKNRSSMGNVVTKFPIRKIAFKSAGKSTLGGVDIWFDAVIGKLNRDEHGQYLGNFGSEDKILVIYKDGHYEFTNFELTNRYEPKEILIVSKYDAESPVSCLHYEGENKIFYIKRFKIETTTMDKKFLFISDTKNSRLLAASLDKYPRFEIKTKSDKKSPIETQTILVDEFVDIRGWKAIGQKINAYDIVEVKMLEPKVEEVITSTDDKTSDNDDSQNDDNQEDNDKQLALF
ncbi:DNA gyrase/topoisomerase IV subunit A [Emticicia oligotrophica DSM 17448]|uniref:DNA gyrase/topoisomerase IV subunit A n=1 Tax=Emticicia oligotrophica (strain DSM 17448 / CIP 109782 / MTCC 6937 / GPTSA100-15) TaxID=929562 RepID=A0ABN4AQ30_EMTOG|nr:DNA gyrase/topoisomerase IV subunit A [Emticicia oligotrophica]AFK03926.1 DNA gyrase/topoisomerase IV subunit A [Emticicia oligotrophica DSM 17448]